MASASGSLWRRTFALSAYLILFAVVFFRLPFAFPVSPSVSASYVFQFNNRVAVLIFLAGAAGFSVLSRGLSLQPATRDSRISRTSALLAITLCVTVGAIYYWLSSWEGLQGEAPYFYGRLSQLAAGKTIYRDFEFAYGPLLLYLPYWTGKLFHLSLIHGYILFWLADWALGIWILYRLVNAIETPSPYRTIVFFLMVLDVAGALLPQGINYAPVRTLMTGGLAMLVYTIHRRGYPLAAVAGACVLCAALATAVSPEHGLAFMLGTSLFFVLCIQPRPIGFWPSAVAMGLCFLAIVAISERTRLYMTLHAFASGGYNYPIMPYLDILGVVSLYLIAACVAYLTWQRRQTDSLTAYLLCICLFGLPACFGRADSGHMQVAAFPAVILAALALGRYPKVAFVAAIAFVYWDATAPFAGQFTPIREQVERRIFNPAQRAGLPYRSAVHILHLLHRDAHKDVIEAKVAQYYDRNGIDPALPAGDVVSAPLNFARHKYADTSGNVDYGYFSGLQDVILPSQVDSIVHWLQVHPERSLILPGDWEERCYSFDEGDAPSFRTWYGIHYASKKRQMRVFFPLCDFIRGNYAPNKIPFAEDNNLWHPIAPANRSSATLIPASNPLLP